jgi:hypothetical protein
VGQGCLPDGITFTTQDQIDNFQTNYPNCTEIEGDVTVGDFWQGGNISNLNGLSVLTSIGGNLVIYNNDALTSLTGLDNIDEGTINDLYIYNNSSLSTCEAEWLCDYLASPNGSINIYDNATGCNNPSEVAVACGITIQCLPFGNYYFLSQADIDNFQMAFPNCTALQGNVNISGSDITNLDGLGYLTSIGGDLKIYDNNVLTSLTGLENLSFIEGSVQIGIYSYENSALASLTGLDNLTSIGGDLEIADNDALTSLTGLEGLTSIGGSLRIGYFEGNPALTSLTGLDNLTSIGSDLYIVYNDALTSLTGLEGLTYIGGGLSINRNPALTSLTGLDNLTSIGGNLWITANDALTILTGLDNLTSIMGFLDIYNNDVLTSLTALEGLTTIGDNLHISDNYALTSLTGLDNIDAGSISNLYIRDNYLLSTCEVKSICDYLSNPNGSIELYDNTTGCDSPEEVLDSCVANAVTIGEFNLNEDVIIYPNPTYSTITIELPTQPSKNTILTLSNTNGQQLITQPITKPQTEIDISHLPKGIYIVKVWNDKDVMVQKIIKQ